MSEARWKQIKAGLERAGMPQRDIDELAASLRADLGGKRQTEFFSVDIYASLIQTEAASRARGLPYVMYARRFIPNPMGIKPFFEQAKGYPIQQLKSQILEIGKNTTLGLDAIHEPVAPVLKVDKAPPNPVVLPSSSEARFDALTVTEAGKYKQELRDRMTTTRTAAVTNLKSVYSVKLTGNIKALKHLTKATEEGYEIFAGAFKTIGDAKNYKMKLVAKMATTVLSEIPFGGKIVAGLVETCADVFKCDTELYSLYQAEKQKTAQRKAQEKGFEGFMYRLRDKVESVTTLGVSKDDICQKGGLQNTLDLKFDEAERKALEEINLQLTQYFGTTMISVTKDVAIYSEQRTAGTLTQYPNRRRASITQIADGEVHKEEKIIFDAINNLFNRQIYETPKKFQKYIELLLWKEYFRSSLEEKWNWKLDHLKNESFPIEEEMIERLIALDIVAPKKLDGQKRTSETVLRLHRLPYDGKGHQTLRIGLFLFFKWYDQINPFDMFRPTALSPSDVEQAKDNYIDAVGNAIEKAKQRRSLGHATIANVTEIAAKQTEQLAALDALKAQKARSA